MERHEVLEMMAALKLAGMRDAFDEVLADGLKRQDPMQRIIGELLKAEIADKQARSIKYQMSGAKLPLAKELADFDFTDTPVNEPLVRELAVGGFLANQRNAVLIGGTGTGKSHLTPSPSRGPASAMAPGAASSTSSTWSTGSRAEARAGRQGRLADQAGPARPRHPRRARLPALRPNRRPAAVPPRQPALRAHLDHRHHQPDLRRMAVRLRRRQDDHRAPRSSDAPLRDHRDRKRLLALQESVLKATHPPAARSPRWPHRNLPHSGPPPAAWWARRPARGPLLWTTCTTSAVHPQRGQHCTPIGGQCATPIDTPRWRGAPAGSWLAASFSRPPAKSERCSQTPVPRT